MKPVVIFDVWGDYAHFRRFYTTTSPLTFPIPPRTALCGLIGAIIGLEKDNNEYLRYLSANSGADIGLRLLSPVKKMLIAENLIHTKEAKGPGMNLITSRTQINYEFLKNPRYRIYFHHDDEDIHLQLRENLSHHRSVYTPCLGLSENIANFSFGGEFMAKPETSTDHVPIHSVLPTEKVLDADFEIAGEYFSIKVPFELDTDRIVKKYGNILFERWCKPIKAKLRCHYWRIEDRDENIVFIE